MAVVFWGCGVCCFGVEKSETMCMALIVPFHQGRIDNTFPSNHHRHPSPTPRPPLARGVTSCRYATINNSQSLCANDVYVAAHARTNTVGFGNNRAVEIFKAAAALPDAWRPVYFTLLIFQQNLLQILNKTMNLKLQRFTQPICEVSLPKTIMPLWRHSVIY